MIDPSNKSALLYNEQIAPQVIKICNPLTEYLDIYKFGYVRFFKNSSFLVMSNGFLEYRKKFYDVIIPNKGFLMNASKKYTNKNKGCYFWPTEFQPNNLYLSLNYECNIWNGITLYYKTQEYTENFTFAFGRNACNKTNFFVNNLDLLQKFCTYFRIAAKNLINCSDKSKLAISKHQFPNSFFSQESKITDEKKQKLLNFLEQSTFQNAHNMKFSRREFECIKYLARGYSMKEIGQILSLSPRTVESYLENVKNKTNCHFKSQIIDLFWNKWQTSQEVF